MSTQMQQAIDRFHAELGYKRLNRTRAELEIILGLVATSLGLVLLPSQMVPGIALFVLGGYLTLAGHRSHLYQSNNELVAYPAQCICDPQLKANQQ